MAASYGGNSIFGGAVKCQMIQHPSAAQRSAFWGLSGVFSSFGGGRGRGFFIEGVLGATTFGNLWDGISLFLSFDDGIARTLVDTTGNDWPQVVFVRMEHDKQFLYGGGYVWVPYRAEFLGLL